MGLKWTLAALTLPDEWSPGRFTGGNGTRGRVRGPRHRPQIDVAGAVCVAYNVRAAISRGPTTADPSSYSWLAFYDYIYAIT
jgi:hypothetical protein